ncbi:FAD-binding protein [Dongia rigui]|uniref:FAD-binding protein n=1 Tax=Dongia rigui TaxID=940149 RepID=A0ABU5E001_9PROT|nr:FAD-binding protein [Dongia rigui]MDY0872859.1 FAD-binding protein [Dongia rigui]
MLLPQTDADLIDIVRSGEPLALCGHGTKAGWGRVFDGKPVSLRKFSGITDYTPAELVMTAGAGTPLAVVEQALADAGQYLAFEPIDLGPLYGGPRGEQTIGGVIATNLSGPRRPFVGAARDFFLGFKGVNGSGEAIKAGAKVVKNVTGYDLPKLIAGSFGTLVAMTEVTLKVMPAPEATATLVLDGVEAAKAQHLFVSVLGSTIEPTGAVFLPDRQRLYFRLEGSGPSVGYRLGELTKMAGEGEVLTGIHAADIWQGLRHIDHVLVPEPALLWSLSVPAAGFADGLASLLGQLDGAKAQVDWGGGRIWLAHSLMDIGAVRQIIRGYLKGRGHATLLRAPDELRRGDAVFSPEVPVPLLKKIRAAFDPGLMFNRGRLHPDL